jgi:uncharacterized membrane protein YvlD (DUF360 family)
MKKLSRMFIFSTLALFLTSLWNKGFILSSEPKFILEAVILLVVSLYVIIPLSKIVLFPFNIISLGLVSFLLYLFILHIGAQSLHLFTIKNWIFPGLKLGFVSIPKTAVSYLGNLILSSLSLSGIINLLEQLL